ncbi:MAG TPA: hypothetical protein DEA89_00275 [Candidatus Moranbacteria bacterium]|nr:MAG: hypothetical protein US09_C0005G0030 [Candidatus Moranbacteria bacterium GW2011_GWD1_36_198]KKQ01288.1 MAG: hypothetical protein US10_C0020G0009 [Candidatus Moranbacteria bacterium GW2011_GWD2_36_198]HAR99866.1 hypothetical protein [Candidatus Moranbacteria bacterium]HBI50350.1 hypothetical protein [Candidatus Moranbacteria bacterium]HBU10345.1 hypothetical protein [Candidatus Moranbacteria bacterium]
MSEIIIRIAISSGLYTIIQFINKSLGHKPDLSAAALVDMAALLAMGLYIGSSVGMHLEKQKETDE